MILKDIIDKFEVGKPYHLTQEEELLILDYLDDSDFIDNGSSRAVYDLMGEYVVKIGLSVEGQNQAAYEVECYEEWHDHEVFATLYAYGKFINVMERVGWDHDCEDEYEYYDAVEDLCYHVSSLTGYDGSDNEQIGFSGVYGCLVLYDYGYTNDLDRDDLVGNMSEWVCSKVDIIGLAKKGIIEDLTYSCYDIDKLCGLGSDEEEDYYDDGEYSDSYDCSDASTSWSD